MEEEVTTAILIHLKSLSQKYGYGAEVFEHLDNSYLNTLKSSNIMLQIIYSIPKSSPNLVRISCIQSFTTVGSPHSSTTMYDLDINDPDLFSSAEEILKSYQKLV